MEYLAKKLTNYIYEKKIITEELVEIYQYGFQCFLELSVSTICSIMIALFFGMLPECLFFFLLCRNQGNFLIFPALYSYALLRRRLAYENIFCLFYRFLLYTHIFPVGSKIFNNIYSDLFCTVSVCRHTDTGHRSG